MATYLMFGRYSREAVKGISAARTRRAEQLIKKSGGKVQGMYALIGEHDLVLIVDLPGNDAAMRLSIQLLDLTGVSFSTAPAIPVNEFDKLVAKRR